MKKIEIKYRTWFKGVPPKPIKLQIPGWSGQHNQHKNGDRPQPWHCIPFVEASTYGLELVYNFDTECHVKNIDGKIIFEGDFEEEQKQVKDAQLPPFSTFAPGHFGMTSSLDIQVPEDYVLRTEPHPRFYTDHTGNVPCCIAGHLQTSWWPKIFFVVFKNPLPNQTIIFRKNEPYAQILIVPKKVEYHIQKMTQGEELQRIQTTKQIDENAKKIAKNDWTDYKGNNFDDKYKILAKINNKGGCPEMKKFLERMAHTKKINLKKKLFIKRKNEKL